jgi:hypothetical protein
MHYMYISLVLLSFLGAGAFKGWNSRIRYLSLSVGNAQDVNNVDLLAAVDTVSGLVNRSVMNAEEAAAVLKKVSSLVTTKPGKDGGRGKKSGYDFQERNLMLQDLYQTQNIRALNSALDVYAQSMYYNDLIDSISSLGLIAIVYENELYQHKSKVDDVSIIKTIDRAIDALCDKILKPRAHLSQKDRKDREGEVYLHAKVNEKHLSKLMVALGRMAKSRLFTFNWSQLSDSSSRNLLTIMLQASYEYKFSGGRGQTLANTMWSLAQMNVDFWIHVPPRLQSRLMAHIFEECSTNLDFTDEAVAVIVLSLSKMNVMWYDLPLPLQSAISKSVCRICLKSGDDVIQAQAISNLVYALGKMGCNRYALTDRVIMALEIAIRKSARLLTLMNDDTIQIMRGLSLMMFKWTPEDTSLTEETRTLLSNALYSSQVSVSKRSGYFGLIRLSTLLDILANLGVGWSSMEGQMKATILLGLSSASEDPSVVRNYNQVEDAAVVARGLAGTLYGLQRLAVPYIELPESVKQSLVKAITIFASVAPSIESTKSTNEIDTSVVTGLSGASLSLSLFSLAKMGVRSGDLSQECRQAIKTRSLQNLEDNARLMASIYRRSAANAVEDTQLSSNMSEGAALVAATEPWNQLTRQTLSNLILGLAYIGDYSAGLTDAVAQCLCAYIQLEVFDRESNHLGSAISPVTPVGGSYRDFSRFLWSVSHYRDLDISSITITAPFVSPFSTSTESILYSIIDKMGSSIAGIQLADGMKIEREEESSSPYDTIAHDTVLCLRAFAKLGVEARMLLPRMDTITSILNFVIQHADARDVILCLHALGKMHFTFLPLVGVQEDDVVAINDPTKTLILHTFATRVLVSKEMSAQNLAVSLYSLGHLLKAEWSALTAPVQHTIMTLIPQYLPSYSAQELSMIMLALSTMQYRGLDEDPSDGREVVREREIVESRLLCAMADKIKSTLLSRSDISLTGQTLVCIMLSLSYFHRKALPGIALVADVRPMMIRAISRLLPMMSSYEANTVRRLVQPSELDWLEVSESRVDTISGSLYGLLTKRSKEYDRIVKQEHTTATILEWDHDVDSHDTESMESENDKVLQELQTLQDSDITNPQEPIYSTIDADLQLYDFLSQIFDDSDNNNNGNNNDIENVESILTASPQTLSNMQGQYDQLIKAASLQCLSQPCADDALQLLSQWYEQREWVYSSLDTENKRIFLNVCTYASCIPDTETENALSKGNRGCMDLQSVVITLMYMRKMGVSQWIDISPTRGRSRLAISIAESISRAITHAQNMLFNGHNGDSNGIVESNHRREVLEMLGQYASIMFCLDKMQAKWGKIPVQLRVALNQGYLLLDALDGGDAKEDSLLFLQRRKASVKDTLVRMQTSDSQQVIFQYSNNDSNSREVGIVLDTNL